MFVFEIKLYEQQNPKYRVFLLGFSVAKVTHCITIMITSCLETIGASYGTKKLLYVTSYSVVASFDLMSVF